MKLCAAGACPASKLLAEFQRETLTMLQLPPHRNVLRLHGVCSSPLALVTDFCERGSL